MRSRLCMSAVLVAGLMAPGWALAETDAASIKQAIEDHLNEIGQEMEDASVSYDDLSVTEMGSGYDVVFKGLVIKDNEGMVVDFGNPRFSVKEQDGDFAFSDVAAADGIKMTHETDQETATVTWTLTRASGLWSPVMEEFKALDLALGDVTVTADEGGASDKQMVAKLGDVTVKTDTEVVSDSDWNQESLLAIGPIQVEDPEGDGSLAIASIQIDSALSNLNPDLYRQQMELVTQLEDLDEVKDAEKAQALKDQMQALGLVAQGGQFGLVIKGVDFVEHRGDQVHFTLEESQLSFRSSAPEGSETGTMGLSLMGIGAKYEGQSLSGEDKLFAMLAPHDWELNIELSKLPVKEVSNAIVELLFAGVGIQDEPMIPFPQIMAAMGQAGSEVVIDSLSLAGDLASLDGEAKGTVDPAAAMGAVGDATLKLIGLAKLESSLGELPAEMQQEIAGALVFLKGLGAPEPDGDKINYVYLFELPADGNVTLNGQPIGALLGQ